MNDCESTLGTEPRQALLAWMQAHSITNSALAQALGVSYEYAWMLTTGRRDISPSVLGRFAACYGFDVAQAVFGKVQE